MDSERGKLFIGGIPWEANEEKLKAYFSTFGEVVETTIVKDRATGRARGFGFVAFADPAVADRVLLEKLTIDGRVIEAKKAIPRDEQHNFARGNNNNTPAYGGGGPARLSRTKKIFVGGLPSTVTEEDFKGYFSQFGVITDVVVMYDHSTQRPRGFGFITFDSEDSVESVVQKTFHELHGKTVEVKKAIPRELSTPGGRSSNAGFGPGPGAGRGAPYNAGHGPGYISTPNNSYGRNAPIPTGRGTFPAYTPGPFAAPGYGAGGGYGIAINSAYGAAYPAAGTYATGYGNGIPAAPYANGAAYVAPGAGYVPAPVGAVPPRSPWGNSGNGFGGGMSPASYGPGGGGYGAPTWPSAPMSMQAAGNAGSYGNGGYGYGTGDASYGPNNTGVGQPRTSADGSGGYGNAYAAAPAYGESNWKADNPQITTSGPGAAGGYIANAGGPGITGVAGQS